MLDRDTIEVIGVVLEVVANVIVLDTVGRCKIAGNERFISILCCWNFGEDVGSTKSLRTAA